MTYIYGAGRFGKILKAFLDDIGCSIEGFVVSDVNYMVDRYIDDIYIFDLYECSINEETIILVAIANQNERIKVINRLLHLNLSPRQIVDCTKLIKDLGTKSITGDAYFCNVCGNFSENFISFGSEGTLFVEHKVIGGGRRKQCICPKCDALDRTRWLLFVIRNYTDVFTKDCNILHFAPEIQIKNILSDSDIKARYFDADLLKENASCKIDMTDIPFRDNYFDYIIASHVLEKIKDEKKAIEEMKRVLKPDGTIILSFPICKDQPTIEEAGIITEEERKLTYGQCNDMRLYGNDYKERLSAYEIEIKEYVPLDILSIDRIEQMSLIPEDTVLLCTILKIQ